MESYGKRPSIWANQPEKNEEKRNDTCENNSELSSCIQEWWDQRATGRHDSELLLDEDKRARQGRLRPVLTVFWTRS